MASQDTEITINLEGQTFSARLVSSDWDTEGHVLAGNEIAVDVEGHAMTLRLPNAGDAQAIKRALAVGAVTALLAGGGIVAMSMAQPQTVPTHVTPISIPQSGPAPISINSDEGLADKASQAASAEFAAQHGQQQQVAAPISGPDSQNVPPVRATRPGVE